MHVVSRKNIIKRITLSALCLLALFLAGCAKHYPKPLVIPNVKPQEKNGLVVRAELFDNQAWKSTFGETSSPQKYGYKSIQIAIGNRSSYVYELKTDSIGVPLVPVKKVAAKISRKDRVLLSVGLALEGVLFIPLSPPFAVGWAIGSFIPLAFPVMINPAYKMMTMGCGEIFTIEPDGLLNRIMFVKTSDYAETFKLPLANKETGAIEEFTIRLNDLAKA